VQKHKKKFVFQPKAETKKFREEKSSREYLRSW